MALTGRAGLLAALAAIVVLLAPEPGLVVLAAALVLTVLVAADLLLAGACAGCGSSATANGGCGSGSRRRSASWWTTRARGGSGACCGTPGSPRPGAAVRRVTLDVPARQRRRLVTTLTPTRRGDREAVAVTVRSVGPLGLAARQRTFHVPWTVRVLPPFLSRRHLPARLARLRELDGRHPALVRGQGTEFDSLREYVVGDDVRSIDWRASARRSDVVVRTWRPERDRRVLIVLDTGRTSAGRVGVAPVGGDRLSGWPRLDWSMDAALLLAALAARAGDRVDFLAYDRAVRAQVSGASRTELLSSLVNAMAPIEAELVEADAAGMVAAVLSRARRRCLVVLLTDLNATAMEEGLLPVLPGLSSRHMVLVASVADPRVAGMAAGRGTAEAVYDAAAAERLRGERREITAVLRRHGVEVVDALPEDVAPALADAYLALKAAGRL